VRLSFERAHDDQTEDRSHNRADEEATSAGRGEGRASAIIRCRRNHSGMRGLAALEWIRSFSGFNNRLRRDGHFFVQIPAPKGAVSAVLVSVAESWVSDWSPRRMSVPPERISASFSATDNLLRSGVWVTPGIKSSHSLLRQTIPALLTRT
jgi:hypothetical protein